MYAFRYLHASKDYCYHKLFSSIVLSVYFIARSFNTLKGFMTFTLCCHQEPTLLMGVTHNHVAELSYHHCWVKK